MHTLLQPLKQHRLCCGQSGLERQDGGEDIFLFLSSIQLTWPVPSADTQRVSRTSRRDGKERVDSWPAAKAVKNSKANDGS